MFVTRIAFERVARVVVLLINHMSCLSRDAHRSSQRLTPLKQQSLAQVLLWRLSKFEQMSQRPPKVLEPQSMLRSCRRTSRNCFASRLRRLTQERNRASVNTLNAWKQEPEPSTTCPHPSMLPSIERIYSSKTLHMIVMNVAVEFLPRDRLTWKR